VDGVEVNGYPIEPRIRLYGADLAGVDLAGADLSGAELWMSDFTGANLTKANLSGARIWMSDFGASNLTEANLTEANLEWAWSESPDNGPVLLHGANLSGANLSDAKLRNAIFSRANLSRATLFGADFHGADLSDVDFTEADLAECDFVGANVRKANFTGARIWCTDFTRADLTGANLDIGSEPGMLTLTGANLTKANLAGVHLGATELEEVVADDSTIWPSDINPRFPPPAVEKDALADPAAVVQEVRSLAETLGIQQLCHFTRVDLLPEIFRTGQILPTSELLLRNPACTRNDYHRRDNHLGFVSCSVQYPNLWVLDRFRERYPDSGDWAVLILRPNRIWAPGAQFSPVNAAHGSGTWVREGLTGLEAMFQPNPPSKYPHPRGPDHLRCCPTDNQAEVLVPDGVPTADVVGIIVETQRRAIDIDIELFSSPSPDGQWQEFIPGSPWVEHHPEWFDSGGLAACISKGVEIPVRRTR